MPDIKPSWASVIGKMKNWWSPPPHPKPLRVEPEKDFTDVDFGHNHFSGVYKKRAMFTMTRDHPTHAWHYRVLAAGRTESGVVDGKLPLHAAVLRALDITKP